MAAAEKCILSLPPEILIKILQYDILDGTDVCRVSQVCHQLKDVSNSNDVWKGKACQRWPLTAELVVITIPEGWRDLFKLRNQIFKQTEEHLKVVAQKNYFREHLSNEEFDIFLQAENPHEKELQFILEDLFTILDTPRHTRLTDKYYARMVARFIHQKLLKEEWRTFHDLPENEKSLEKGAYLISSWMQPLKRVSMADISAELDSIADMVRAVLRSDYSKAKIHPACKKDNSTADFAENLWTLAESKQVLKALNTVLYDQLGFQGNNLDYFNAKNSFIDEVLHSKKGIPVTLSIIYSAVARRLGVICEPNNLPNHVLLVFKDYIGSRPAGCEQLTLIDAFNRGKELTSQDCVRTLLEGHQVSGDSFYIAAPQAILERMARNLHFISTGQNVHQDRAIPVLQDALTLSLAISPSDQGMIAEYATMCISMNVNLTEVIAMLRSNGLLAPNLISQCELQRRFYSEQTSEREVKIRSKHPEVAFSVGMVMKHRKYAYTCVIYGWDHECQASKDWIQIMRVPSLSKKQYQPFYNVLVEDGSSRYAAQENLLYTQEVKEITHDEVGRYFQEFSGRYYLPNPDKQHEYPDDIAVTKTLMDAFFRVPST